VNVLLDTNVLSEVQRPTPDANVLAWLDSVDEDRVYMSVVSIAELRRGIALMDQSRRKSALTTWLADDLPARFAGRMLPIDHDIATYWGDLMAASRKTGVALSTMDAFFAATALMKNLILATRNVEDFTALSLSLHNQWDH
jgi:predicted nucleic acid-binding protein